MLDAASWLEERGGGRLSMKEKPAMENGRWANTRFAIPVYMYPSIYIFVKVLRYIENIRSL